jgi:hypothetical protein
VEPLYASCGARDEELRRRPSMDAAAAKGKDPSHRIWAGHSLSQWVNNFDARSAIFPFTGIFRVKWRH